MNELLSLNEQIYLSQEIVKDTVVAPLGMSCGY